MTRAGWSGGLADLVCWRRKISKDAKGGEEEGRRTVRKGDVVLINGVPAAPHYGQLTRPPLGRALSLRPATGQGTHHFLRMIFSL